MIIYEDSLKKYDALLDIYKIERKGKTMPYTSHNGHMFSFLDEEGNLALRLDKKDLADFINKYDAQLIVRHGKTMKEYVKIPESIFSNSEKMRTYLAKSYEFVQQLKPKSTKNSIK